MYRRAAQFSTASAIARWLRGVVGQHQHSIGPERAKVNAARSYRHRAIYATPPSNPDTKGWEDGKPWHGLALKLAQKYRLPDGKLAQAIRAEFDAEAGLFDATERCVRVQPAVRIDPGGAAFQTAHKRCRPHRIA